MDTTRTPWLEDLYAATVRDACEHLDTPPQELDHILDTHSLSIGGVPFTLRLHAPTRQVEVFGDCGLPCPGQELALYRHLLELALESELPALRFALHPVSGHVVVRGSLALAQRQEGELCAALLVLATAQAQELRQKFDWEAQTKAA